MSVVSIGCGYTVAPLVGAWIEINNLTAYSSPLYVAPLVGAWIEIWLVKALFPQ